MCGSAAETNGVIEMPIGFLKTVSVGFEQDGRWHTLVYDNTLVETLGIQCGDNQVSKPTTESVEYNSGEFYLGFYPGYGNIFANSISVGGGRSSAYWNEDRNRRVVIIAPHLYNKKLAVRYMSYGADLDGDSTIPFYYVQSAKYYLMWQEKLAEADTGRAEYYHRLFDVEFDRATGLSLSVSNEKYRDFINSLTYLRA
jgi:hypothetical protein